ncbi:MAG: TrkH family potassium uptake protein [Candidatus Aenigmatarchaeota archaeon]
MDFKSVFSHVGMILEMFAIMSLIPIFISFIFGENMYTPFFLTAVLSFAIGSLLDKKFPKNDLDLGSSMAVASISFVLLSLFGAIPFLPYASPVDAVFESVSGFTTTGLSVLNVELIPNTLLFWRSFTQWIGGIGILLIFLLLVGSPGISSNYLYKAEAREEKIEASIQHTVKKIFKIYGMYTIVGIILLSLVGMPIFDAILVSFSSISTGGFTAKAGGIGAYNIPMAEFVIVLLMIVGATSFFIHDKLLKKQLFTYVRNAETKLFWGLIAVFASLLTISFLDTGQGFRHGIFLAFSALTTTGFTTTSQIPPISMLLLIILMVIGGYAGSTAGGIKLIRFGIIGKSIPWLARKISYPPEAVIHFKIKEKTIKESELTIISLFISIYIIILLIGTVVITFLGYSPLDAFFHVTSAQGSVGLSTIPLADMHFVGKIMLMINMLLGRLEIFPFIILLYAFYRKKIRRSSF